MSIDNISTPELVYFNFPVKYASLLVTLPNKFVQIPQNAESEPNRNELSLILKNNGAYGKYEKLTNSNILDALRFHFGDMYDILKEMDQERINEFSRENFISFLEQLMDESRRSFLQESFKEKINLEGRLYPLNDSAKMEISGAFYKGDFISFEGFSSLRPRVEEDLKILECATHVRKGDYLYRAVLVNEWSQILRDKSFLIRVETNFEDSVGSQVEQFACNSNYAGKIIRVKVEGPFFRNAGLFPPRVVSVCPHFANSVDVKEGDEWVNLNEYSGM